MIVICRGASDPLISGASLGYACKSCRIPLQVSPSGVRQIRAGGDPLCSECGFKIGESLIANQSKSLAGIAFILSPGAREQFERDPALAGTLKDATKILDPADVFELIDKLTNAETGELCQFLKGAEGLEFLVRASEWLMNRRNA